MPEKIFIILILVLFPLGQLERIPLENPQIGLYAHDLVIGLLVLWWLARKIKLGPAFVPRLSLGTSPGKRLGRWILAFWLVAWVSFLINAVKREANEILVALFYLLRWGCYASLYFIIKDLNIISLLNCSIVKWLIAAGTVGAVFGLLQ